MKTTIYELLGMIKDGKAPQRIKYCGAVYIAFEFEGTNGIDYEDKKSGDLLFADRLIVQKKLNDEVEILEEENKIPEKIQKDDFEGINEEEPKLWIAIRKINEIIDYLKSKGE